MNHKQKKAKKARARHFKYSSDKGSTQGKHRREVIDRKMATLGADPRVDKSPYIMKIPNIDNR